MGVFGSFGDWVGGALDYLGENNALGSAIIAGTTLISGLMQPDKAPMVIGSGCDPSQGFDW